MAFDPVSYAMGTKGGGGSSGGGVLVVHDIVGTLDKTWQEIHDADFAVLKRPDGGIEWTSGAVEDEGDYIVGFWTFGMGEPNVYIANTANGYPACEESPPSL